MKIRLSLLVLMAILLSCQPESPKHNNTNTALLTAALNAEAYLHENIIEESPNTLSWKMMPDSANSPIDVSLYSGVPGIVLFYLELYNATGNTDHLNKAEKGANYMLETMSAIKPNVNTVGLYTGIAGIGYMASEIYQVTKAPKYKEAIVNTVDMLANSATKTVHGVHWGMTSDIVYGAAGIGLYLNKVADEYNIKKADILSVLVANQLLEQSTVSEDGLRWKMSPGMDIHMDNFSHGTAGVAYYLAEMFERTGNEDYLVAAKAAGNWLAKSTNDEGLVAHHLPGGEDLYYLSWCHGPAGTTRLYYALYEITGENQWLDLINNAANGVIALEIDEKRTPGYWNNVGKCCGDSGVAEHYLWLYEITGNEDYLSFAKKLTQNILAAADNSEGILKWIHAENRRSPDEIAAQTGLMQGTAGIGLWLLQLNAFEEGKPSQIQLPDKPKAKRIEMTND
ncbi:lanthionine synthetase LanC family protein [Roseivirga misakiensis]|uniref:Lanthionine synthetase C family protein n=1 Tax=Roseivirga misakiensis TaxID=1563681 RepID=A0A1E5SY73_9BACT|nr:lanthionine synthetase LanC family protein [Roseivirga misakiensis]OEK04066.1 hypothetical protein BFP71_11275 [Roseivirga misakiensis]